MDEFACAIPKMEEWGIDMSDPQAQWAKCDTNGGGFVLYDEFVQWAIQENLDVQEDDDDDEEEP